MQYITVFDYLLLPVYLFLFYTIVKRKSLKYKDDEIRKYFLIAFGLRMFGSIAYSMLVQYYYGYGDSFTFFYGSNFLTDQISKNISNVQYMFANADEVFKFFNAEVGDVNVAGYFAIGSSLFVMKISAVVSYFSFNKFLIVSLFFGFFSFAGQWRLFLVFNDINKGVNRKLLAYAVLFTPSIWFWGSGLMKDSVCIGGIGFIISILYNAFVKKKINLFNIVFLVFLIFLIYNIKSYIILVFLLGLAAIFLTRLFTFFKNIILRSFFILTFFTICAFTLISFNAGDQLQQLVEESQLEIQNYQKNYEAVNAEDERSMAGIAVKDIDLSLKGMILRCPAAIGNCLYRPFLWESRKVIILFTALESTLMLLCTLFLLFKTRVVGFFKVIFTNEYVMFSLIISLAFALIIGFTTFNYGAMIRYKIILMPFYYFMLVNIYNSISVKKVTQ